MPADNTVPHSHPQTLSTNGLDRSVGVRFPVISLGQSHRYSSIFASVVLMWGLIAQAPFYLSKPAYGPPNQPGRSEVQATTTSYIPHFTRAASAFAGSFAILITAFRLTPVALAIAEWP